LKDNAMKKRIFILITVTLFLIDISPTYTQSAGQSLNRKKALALLKGCSRSVQAKRCNEDTAEYLIRLYQRGDRSLLGPLLDAGVNSDGALAASLGVFYGELLRKEPVTFLKALISRPRKQQHELAFLAGAMDGSGMSKEMLREVQTKLIKIRARRGNRLSSVARLSLMEVNRANKVEQ
jgi:hypothetical protein